MGIFGEDHDLGVEPVEPDHYAYGDPVVTASCIAKPIEARWREARAKRAATEASGSITDIDAFHRRYPFTPTHIHAMIASSGIIFEWCTTTKSHIVIKRQNGEQQQIGCMIFSMQVAQKLPFDIHAYLGGRRAFEARLNARIRESTTGGRWLEIDQLCDMIRKLIVELAESEFARKSGS